MDDPLEQEMESNPSELEVIQLNNPSHIPTSSSK